jgi:hypothetical protein
LTNNHFIIYYHASPDPARKAIWRFHRYNAHPSDEPHQGDTYDAMLDTNPDARPGATADQLHRNTDASGTHVGQHGHTFITDGDEGTGIGNRY